MRYFDTHAHIGLIYDDPIEQLLVCQQAKQAGVGKIISICNSLLDFKQVYENLKPAEHVTMRRVSPSVVGNPLDELAGHPPKARRGVPAFNPDREDGGLLPTATREQARPDFSFIDHWEIAAGCYPYHHNRRRAGRLEVLATECRRAVRVSLAFRDAEITDTCFRRALLIFSLLRGTCPTRNARNLPRRYHAPPDRIL